MHTTERAVLIVLVICFGLAGLCSGSAAEIKLLSLDEVMSRVKENLDSLKSYIIKIEAHASSAASVTGAQKWILFL